MGSPIENGFHEKEFFLLKGTASTISVKRNYLRYKEWFLLNGRA